MTNCLPDNPEKCLNALAAVTARPVHIFYISEKQDLDRDILDFLKCLTSATKGSCYRLSLNANAPAEQVNPSVSGRVGMFFSHSISYMHLFHGTVDFTNFIGQMILINFL